MSASTPGLWKATKNPLEQLLPLLSVINKTNARTGEIIGGKAKCSGQGCVMGGAGRGWRGTGSALEELPWALQLNCDHFIKRFEVKDLKLLMEGA